MAMNLRARLPASDTLVIYDQNTEATSRFLSGLETPQASIGTEVGEVSETKCMVKLVNSPREVAERSVSGRHSSTFLFLCGLYDE